MKRSFSIAVVIMSVVVVAVLVAIGGDWLAQQASAQPVAELANQQGTINVNGIGRVTARPDLANIRLGVETEGDTPLPSVPGRNAHPNDAPINRLPNS